MERKKGKKKKTTVTKTCCPKTHELGYKYSTRKEDQCIRRKARMYVQLMIMNCKVSSCIFRYIHGGEEEISCKLRTTVRRLIVPLTCFNISTSILTKHPSFRRRIGLKSMYKYQNGMKPSYITPSYKVYQQQQAGANLKTYT